MLEGTSAEHNLLRDLENPRIPSTCLLDLPAGAVHVLARAWIEHGREKHPYKSMQSQRCGPRSSREAGRHDESPVVRREVLVVIIRRQLVCYALVHKHCRLCCPTPRHIVLSVAAACSPAKSRFRTSCPNHALLNSSNTTTVRAVVACTPARAGPETLLPTVQFSTRPLCTPKKGKAEVTWTSLVVCTHKP